MATRINKYLSEVGYCSRSWSPDGWLVEDLKKKETDQMSLF